MEKRKHRYLKTVLSGLARRYPLLKSLREHLLLPWVCKGFTAIITGHVIGCIILFLAGLIGGRTGKSAMETVKMSFGQKGSLLFSTLNVLQLIGWTAIMIVSGAAAATAVCNIGGNWVWSIIIGALIIFWILVGIKNLGKLNMAAMGALFV